MTAWIRMIEDQDADPELLEVLKLARTPHGTVDNVDLIVENDLVEFRDHLPLAKFAQVATPLTGRAA